MDIPVLYLIRHGQTKPNAANQFRGDSDVPLTPKGRKDAEDVAEFLKGIEPSFIISSDRSRAIETTQILQKYFDAPVHTSPELRAWDVGEFTGKPRNKENLAEIQKYIDDPCLTVPGGESLAEFASRTMPAIDECFQLANCHGVGFVVAHSSVIHQLGSDLLGSHTALVVDPGGVVLVGLSGEGCSEAEAIFKPMEKEENSESIS